MRKCLSWLMAVVLLAACASALGEGTAAPAGRFTMAGLDDSSTNHDWESNMFFRRMEERTGISFIFDQYGERKAWEEVKQNIGVRNGDLPDVLFKADLTPREIQDWYEKGILIDLRPYLEDCAPNLMILLEAHPEWLEAITLPDGAIVALPSFNELQNNNAMWINTTWLAELGLDMPSTAEELTEVLRAFKTLDPNRNGRRDEVPLTFTGMWDLRYLGHAFGLVSNDYYIVAEDGVVSSILTREENRAFLTWLNLLWQEGLIDQMGFSSLDSTRRITDKDAAMTFGVFMGPTPMSMVPAGSMNQYSVLMPLTYEGSRVYRDLTGDVVRGTFAITSACEDPAALVRWVDYLYTEEGCHLAQAGLEGEDFVFNEDGTWDWVEEPEVVATTVMADVTIADGGAAPGLSSLEFQLRFDDLDTHRLVTELQSVKQCAVLPYPIRYLTAEKEARIAALQAEIAPYAEQQMIWFVVGDVPLNDETWDEFCRTLKEKGLDEMVALWQEAL